MPCKSQLDSKRGTVLHGIYRQVQCRQWATYVNLIVDLEEKSGDHQSQRDSSSGDHECLSRIFHWISENVSSETSTCCWHKRKSQGINNRSMTVCTDQQTDIAIPRAVTQVCLKKASSFTSFSGHSNQKQPCVQIRRGAALAGGRVASGYGEMT